MTRWARFCRYWPYAWIILAESIIWILTLAQWKPVWAARYGAWYSLRETKKLLAQKDWKKHLPTY